jgi:hypothetical protein
MEELVQFLYRMGIEPLGAIETAARIVEKRTWSGSASAEQAEEEATLESPTIDEDSTHDGQTQVRFSESPTAEAKPPKPERSRVKVNGSQDRVSQTPANRQTVRTERNLPLDSTQLELLVEQQNNGAQDGHSSKASRLHSSDWFSIAKWAKENDCLENWQRRFAFTLGVHVNKGMGLTDRQIPHAEKILDEVLQSGYKFID